MSTLIDAVAKAQVSDRLREAEQRRVGAVSQPAAARDYCGGSGSDT